METGTKTIVAAICGGVFGLVTGLTVSGISVAALDSSTSFDQAFADYWSNMLMLAFVPGAVIAGIVMFAFISLTGLLRFSTIVGMAGGTVLGSFIVPPESILPGVGGIDALVLVLWEWMFGGVGGVLGSLVERAVERFE